MHNQREDGSKMLKKRGGASLKDIFNYAMLMSGLRNKCGAKRGILKLTSAGLSAHSPKHNRVIYLLMKEDEGEVNCERHSKKVFLMMKLVQDEERNIMYDKNASSSKEEL